MVDCTSLDDFETNKTPVEKMKSIIKPLKFSILLLQTVLRLFDIT